MSECYSSVICEGCNSKLSEFADFQSELIENQTRLYHYYAPEAEPEFILEAPTEIDEQQMAIIKTEAAEEEYQVEALDENFLIIQPNEYPLQPSTPRWTCCLCDANLRTRIELRRHLKQHKDPKKEEHSAVEAKAAKSRRMCQLCGLSFAPNGWYHHVSSVSSSNSTILIVNQFLDPPLAHRESSIRLRLLRQRLPRQARSQRPHPDAHESGVSEEVQLLALPSVAAFESGSEEPRADPAFHHHRRASVRVWESLRVEDEALSAQNDGAHQGSLPLPALRTKLHGQERSSEARHEDSQREDPLRRLREDFRARHVHEQAHEDSRAGAIPVQRGGLR